MAIPSSSLREMEQSLKGEIYNTGSCHYFSGCRLKPLRAEVKDVRMAPLTPNYQQKLSPISVTRSGTRDMSQRRKWKSSVCIYWRRAPCAHTHIQPTTP